MEENADPRGRFEFPRQGRRHEHQLIALDPDDLVLFMTILDPSRTTVHLHHDARDRVVHLRVRVEQLVHQRPIREDVVLAEPTLNSPRESHMFTLLCSTGHKIFLQKPW